ncbi:hypothetical protein VIGAN_07164200 [Vigna angularis var. angularis]|uniref:Uncharacterized protein n=1 Tax=Vigna angularis var. angularis TaxID=157739 RepID=A0A0S3SIY2_PHAAN|nr:hypothetical protein VIGAN_07164200 [Vigna angularis var. angularis]
MRGGEVTKLLGRLNMSFPSKGDVHSLKPLKDEVFLLMQTFCSPAMHELLILLPEMFAEIPNPNPPCLEDKEVQSKVQSTLV